MTTNIVSRSAENFPLFPLKDTKLSAVVTTQDWVQSYGYDNYTPLSTMIDELSNNVNPKLSTIADLVVNEVTNIDSLSGEMSSYAKKEDVPYVSLVGNSLSVNSNTVTIPNASEVVYSVDNQHLSDLVLSIYEEVVSAGTIISTEINPKLDVISTLVSAETENVDKALTNVGALSSSMSAYLLSSDAGIARNVLPISSLSESTVELTQRVYTYRVTDAAGTGVFPTLSAPTDVAGAYSDYYFSFELEWTTSAMLGEFGAYDWINKPEIITDGSEHVYSVAGRWDSGADTFTLNCWRSV